MTLVFAHRGYSANFPENTMKAFREAGNEGADGLELDVQMTKDGHVVVIHDEKVDRTTDGKGFVKDFTAAELRKLDAGYKYKDLMKKEPVPHLKEVLEWLSQTTIICNIELKNALFPYEGMENKVIALIREYQLEDRIIISSFNHYSIVKVATLASDIETAPLLAEGLYMPWVYSQSIRAKGFHPHYSAAPNEIIHRALEQNIAVRPYTVNKESEMIRLMKVGCSAIITDDPVKAIRLRKSI